MDSLRLSDVDREAAVDLLGEQYAVGRLTKDEFDERSDAVWSAKTRGDLAPVFVDLPARASATRPTRGWPIPLAPVLFVLIALAVLTHLPFVLLALVLFLMVGRFHRGSCGGRRRLR